MRYGRILTLALAALCAAASCQQAVVAWSLYLARPRTMEFLDRASNFAPLNATFWRERGILRLDSDPRTSERLLRRAVALNAYETDSLVGLGLLAESGGRLEEAEDYLTRAANLSRRFKPQWALAFFYARQGPTDKLWRAASAAANVRGADTAPVFRLSHDLQKDPERIPDLLRLESQDALQSYARFLLKEDGPTALGRVALRIEPVPEARAVLLAAVDRLIAKNRVEEAVAVWNRLAAKQGTETLAPAQGRSLTNGQFADSEHAGFDWRSTENPGIEIQWGRPGDLRIEFSGRQAEAITLLEQFVPVAPNQSYRLTFDYGTSGLNRLTGLTWQVLQPNSSGRPSSAALNAVALNSVALNSVPQGGGALPFRAAGGVSLVRVALRYDRLPGTMRLEGVVILRSAELKML